ncbi:MAG TPA: NnrU family protein [Caulobacteraceae bacterium]
MTGLIAAAAAFVLLHLLVSGTRLRDALTGAVGQGPYTGLFSLVSVGLLVWVGFAFAAARSGGADPVYWNSTHPMRVVQAALQFVALFFIVVGLTTPNPTSVRQESALDRPDVARGILRVTRHPFLWGAAIWAAGHLLVGGDLAGIVLFASMLVLALSGTLSIDAKRRRARGASWDAFAQRTSNVPFAAIAAGRQSFSFAEMGWWRLALVPLIWGALIFVHPYAFGVAPLR